MDIEHMLSECDTCGGNLEYDAATQVYTCAYCGNTYADRQENPADSPIAESSELVEESPADEASDEPMRTTQLFVDPEVFALADFLEANLGRDDFPWSDLGPVLSANSRITPEQYLSFVLRSPDCEEKRQCAYSFLRLLSTSLKNCSCSINLGGLEFVATPWHVYTVASSDCAQTISSIAAGMYAYSGQPDTQIMFGGRAILFKDFVQENKENISDEALAYFAMLPSL